MGKECQYTEEEIQGYMNQFKVDRETAIKEINIFKEDYDKQQRKLMEDVYRDIINDSH